MSRKSLTAVTVDVDRSQQCARELKDVAEKDASSKNQIVIACDVKSPFNLKHFKSHLICCVRILPRLHDVKVALKRRIESREKRRASVRQVDGSLSLTSLRIDEDVQGCPAPNPTLWSVENSAVSEITVMDTITGKVVLEITDPKLNVLVSSLLHAPFRGFINHQLDIIPIDEPQDILKVRELAIINTDYVWVGFVDGSIRLFPADPKRVREQDRSQLLAKGELADLVYELPKYHTGAVVAIRRSPCHEDNKTADLVTTNRLSSRIQELTAATSRGYFEEREHLSLVCTASEDSCVVVWDVQKIYRRLEEMRASSHKDAPTPYSHHSGTSIMHGDVVTFSIKSSPGVSDCVVRSACTMVKVRPLFKLKGDVGGLRTLAWTSTLVTTVGYEKPRDVVAMTRDAKEWGAPALLRSRRAVQTTTRWEEREEHRRMLRLSEREMREVEEELNRLLPPLTPEPPQWRRVNLLVAGDRNGRVHLWDLDEELARGAVTADTVTGAHAGHQTPLSGRSPSSSRGESYGTRTISPRRRSTRLTSFQTEKVSTTWESRWGSVSFADQNECSEPLLLSPVNVNEKQCEKKSKTRVGEPQVALMTPCSRQKSVRKGGKDQTWMSTTIPSTPGGGSVIRNSATKGGTITQSANRSKTSKRSSRTQSTQSCSQLSIRKSFEWPGSRGPGSINDSSDFMMKPRTNASVTSLRTTTSFVSKTADATHTSGTGVYLSCRPVITEARKSLFTPRKSVLQKATTTTTNIADKCKDTTNHGNDMTPICVGRRRTASKLHNGKRSPLRCKVITSDDGVSEMVGQEAWMVRWNSKRDTLGARSSSGYHLTGSRASVHSAMNASRLSVCDAMHPEWMNDHQFINEIYSRKAKCQMDLIDGGTVAGIAVDLPPVITVTMRRLPDPPEMQYSLLEQPTEEEMCRRQLANSFNRLSDERALYHTFEKLQFFVAVEGTLMNMQCVPKAQNEGTNRATRMWPVYVETPVMQSSFNFNVVFRRRILERHSQPIVLMYVDHLRHQLWVARNDGLLSIFSTETKTVITRVPHPSSPKALGPPSETEWKRTQREMDLMKGRPFRLEIHKECKKYPPAHFVSFTPISLLQEFNLMRTSAPRAMHSPTKEPSDHPEHCMNCITIIDDRCSLDECTRSREVFLSARLEALKQHRRKAVCSREVKRDCYNTLYKIVGDRIRSLVGQCAILDALHLARRAFGLWLHHNDYFSREYVLRQTRKKRLTKLAQVADVFANHITLKIQGVYFGKWVCGVRTQLIKRRRLDLRKLLDKRANVNLKLKGMRLLVEHSLRLTYWLRWKAAKTSLIQLLKFSSPDRSSSPISGLGTTQRFSSCAPRLSRHRSVSFTIDDERYSTFLDFSAIIRRIYALRHEIIRFRRNDAEESVLDLDSFWLDTIDAAVNEAETQSAHAIKSAVFAFGLLPLLEGLLATAEEVLLHSSETPIADIDRSGVRGCLLCIDCIYADPDDLERVAGDNDGSHVTSSLPPSTTTGSTGFNCLDNHTRGGNFYVGVLTQRERELRDIFEKAMDTHEYQSQIANITAHRSVFEQFFDLCSPT